MGCDIHIYTEMHEKLDDKLIWINVDCWKYNRWYELYPASERQFTIEHIYKGRWYSMFAVLANVRNYGKCEPISMPRGLPEDVSKPVREECERWGTDGHSHSWFTLAELKDAKKQRGIIHYIGWVTDEGKKQIEDGQMPDFWEADSSEYCKHLMEWDFEFHLLDPIIDSLERVKKRAFRYSLIDDENERDQMIRIVFWFDN